MSLPVFALHKLEFEKIRAALSVYLSTSAGEKCVADLQPLTNRHDLENRLTETAEMMHLLHASEHPPLQTLYDITDAVSKSRIERYVLDGKNLAQIGRWTETARLLRQFFERHRESTPRLWNVMQHITPVPELEKLIQQTVDVKGEIKDDASPELKSLSRSITTRKEEVRSLLQQLLQKAHKSGMSTGEEATLRGGRMVIPVKSEYKRKIKGFIHDTSATGQTVYIEPVEVFDKNNEIKELEAAWKREVDRLLRSLTRKTGEFAKELNRNMELTGYVDICYAKTKLGLQWKGVIPEISDDGSVTLNKCRNPLLILKYARFDDAAKNIVPLNLEMDRDEQGIIITGPNAGGKSVTLKTFGLTIVLAQCGIPVPAQEDVRLPCTHGLYIDMGDEQSIDNDLSTFSSRLNWMKEVLTESESPGWALIDEAGSGTDPDEGTALIKAFLECLAEKGIRSIVTTHHGALKTFAHETDGWSNASMEFDRKSLTPTYRFQKGIPGSSYAFEIADRLQVPSELTKRARDWVGSGKNRLESLIISLEQDSQRLREQMQETEQLKISLSREREALEQRLKRVRDEKDEIRKKAETEAELLLQNANRKIEQAIKAASEKDKEELKVKRKEVDQLGKQLKKRSKQKLSKQKSSNETDRPVRIGDTVRIAESNTVGELTEINGKKAMILVNGIRISTLLAQLECTEQKGTSRTAGGYKRVFHNDDTTRPFALSLDIRGKRGDEAIREVTRYVDEGLARSMERLTIIHGRGDGILRKLVHDHLRSRKDVKHFETAPVEEGGDGCTLVFL